VVTTSCVQSPRRWELRWATAMISCARPEMEHRWRRPNLRFPRAVLPDGQIARPPEEHARLRLIRPSEGGRRADAEIALAGTSNTVFARAYRTRASGAFCRPPHGRTGARGRRYLSMRGVDAEIQESASWRRTFAILDHPQFAAAFAPGSRAEAAIVADLPDLGAGARVSGRIDLLAVTGDAVLAIDFKTKSSGARHARTMWRRSISARWRFYRAALSKLFPGQTNRLRARLDRRPHIDVAACRTSQQRTSCGFRTRLDHEGSGS